MIDFLRNFFSVNQEIIYFIYGLTFFIMGLAIALQSRHASHLELARSLNWLAAFGFLHGLHEWGDLFIPLQGQYLAVGYIHVLHYLHLILLSASFACLYGFGLALLEPMKHRRWLHAGFAILLTGWVVISAVPFRMWYSDFSTWYNSVNALARYLIGLPSGLLAAYALRQHTLTRIGPYDVPRIFNALQISGITMAIYALAAGLIVPPAPYFPAGWLNTVTFEQYLLIPPQLIRAFIGLAMALTTIRFLDIFDVETRRQIESMEQERILSGERERLARELHDGTIQKVYTAALLVRSAEKLAEPDTPLAGRLATAVGVLDDAIGDLRDNLSELQLPAKTPGPLAAAIRKLATDPRISSLVSVELNLALPEGFSLSPERSEHFLAILQEALANIVRHAHARNVYVTATCTDDHLRLLVRDDGIGLPARLVDNLPEQASSEHGLRNMSDRAALLHGRLEITRLTRGTQVSLDIPLEG